MHQLHGSCHPDDGENKLHTGGVASWKFTHSFGIHKQSIISHYLDIVAQELASIRVCAPHAPVAWVMPPDDGETNCTQVEWPLENLHTAWNAKTKYNQSLHWFCGARTCWDTYLCAKICNWSPQRASIVFNICEVHCGFIMHKQYIICFEFMCVAASTGLQSWGWESLVSTGLKELDKVFRACA